MSEEFNPSVSVDHAIAVLNRAVQKDREAVQALIQNRVPCNVALAEDSTIQVGDRNGQYSVGLLGIVNGIFGADENQFGYIWARFTETGDLIQFERAKP